jgi:hypothetical protein
MASEPHISIKHSQQPFNMREILHPFERAGSVQLAASKSIHIGDSKAIAFVP